MPLVSARRYAEHRGISHTAVQKAIRQGRIRATPGGMVDVEQADRDWTRNTSPMNAPRVEATMGGPAYAQARAFREQYLARTAKLDFEERSGTLLRRDEVVAEFSNLVRSARDRLLSIPDRISPILAVESDATRVYQILSDEIREALVELSNHNYANASSTEETDERG